MSSTITSCRKFFIGMVLVFCCGPVNGMANQGKSSDDPLAVLKKQQVPAHWKLPLSLLASGVSLVKLASMAKLPIGWVCGFVKEHPKTIMGVCLLAGALGEGSYYLWKMTGKTSSVQGKHELHVILDTGAFGQVKNGVQNFQNAHDVLQNNINSKVDGIDTDTSQFLEALTEFGGVLDKSLNHLGDSVQELAQGEELNSLGREIGGLVSDVAKVLGSNTK